MVILLAITAFPLVYSLTLSLHEWNMGSWKPWRFVGLDNFKTILRYDTFFWTATWVTLKFVVVAVMVQALLGFGVAVLLNRELRYGGIIRTTLILPTMMTPVVVGLIWRFMFNPDLGMANYLMSLAHLPMLNWLGDPRVALWAVLIADTWEWTPFMALVILAGLHALPHEPFEAASIDGASPWQTVRFVTLPMLRSTLLVAILIRLMDAFKTFDLVFVMTKGGPGMTTEVLSFYTYRNGFKFFHMGYAAALSYIMLVVVVLISQLLIRYLGREEPA